MQYLKLMMMGAALFVLMGCDKQERAGTASNNASEWQDYVGKYPISGLSPAPAFLSRPDVTEAIQANLPPDVLNEYSTLLVESPIEEPEKGFLLMHLCEAHNCPHGVDIVFAVDTKEVAMVFYRVDGSDAPAKITCYSKAYKTLGELPESVRTPLAAHTIASVVPSLMVENIPCE